MNVSKRRARLDRGAKQRGFTLIEMVIVVAIVAILSAIAYPSYTAYKVRANRVAAQAMLMELTSRQQQYFIDARRYSADLSTLGGTPGGDVAAFYTFDAPTVDNAGTPPSYVLTASPKSGTIQSTDGQLMLTSTGARTRGGVSW